MIDLFEPFKFKTPSTRWLTEEMSPYFPFTIDTITAGALMS